MSTTITPVQGDHIVSILMIDLTIESTTYYISNAYKPVTFSGNTYTQLGSFLNVDTLTEDIRTTNGDIAISLSGIPTEADYINLVLTTKLKGGQVIIRRGFMDKDDLELDTSEVYTRFKGIITNFNISEDVNIMERNSTNSATIVVANTNSILEQRISGQRTNPEDRKRLFPSDQVFDRIPELVNLHFDFGKPFNSGGNYGGGGGCFVADTQITMKDGTFKSIQDVKVGDVITSMKNDGSIAPGEVLEITTPVVDTIAVYTIGNIVLECTPDHPVYIDNKGWCSLDPHATKQNHNLDVSVITVNDCVVLEDIDTSTNIIQHIEIKQQETQTYNLSSVKDYHTYFANGVLVHNKGGRGGGGGGRNEQQR